MKGEAKAKVSEPGGQERVTDENGDFGGRYRASEAERYSRKSGVNVPDSPAMGICPCAALTCRVTSLDSVCLSVCLSCEKILGEFPSCTIYHGTRVLVQ